uniref:Impact N-terminal domain-containing protein n=1 Tax=Oryza rufipogon TaxID=4529 RepID=A0A0E0QKA5_ORYRU
MAAVRIAPRLRSLPLLLPGPDAAATAAAVHRSCSSCGGSLAALAPARLRAMSSSSSSSSVSPSPYTTLVGRVSCEREIKKSKFIAIAAPVPDERAAMSFLNEVSDPRATHNCWAYKLGEQFRYNDDGEPSSTAGKPIYSAIISSGIDMVMVVVIRYFGGIKLGTGGLVRAYGGVASECLKDAPTCLVKPKARVGMEVPFDLLGTVYHQLQHYQAEDIKQDYDTGKDGTVMVMFKLEYEKIENLGNAALLLPLKYSAFDSTIVLSSNFRLEFPNVNGRIMFY